MLNLVVAISAMHLRLFYPDGESHLLRTAIKACMHVQPNPMLEVTRQGSVALSIARACIVTVLFTRRCQLSTFMLRGASCQTAAHTDLSRGIQRSQSLQLTEEAAYLGEPGMHINDLSTPRTLTTANRLNNTPGSVP